MELFSSFWQTIKQWDQTALFHVNQVWQNSIFDAVLPWVREAGFWLPLYLFFIAFTLINFGKKGFYWVIFFVLTIVLCDQLSSSFLKNYVGRLRPCNDPFMLQFIKLRVQGCPSSFSFTSSHAANHFGMATFMHFSLKNSFRNKTGWLFLWAFVVCYAQVYVGVHYPLDILGGMLAGMLAGGITAYFFNRYVHFTLPTYTGVMGANH